MDPVIEEFWERLFSHWAQWRLELEERLKSCFATRFGVFLLGGGGGGVRSICFGCFGFEF